MNKKLKKEFEEKFTWLNKENTEEGVRLLSISKSDKLWTWINENFSLKSQTAKAVGVETDVIRALYDKWMEESKILGDKLKVLMEARKILPQGQIDNQINDLLTERFRLHFCIADLGNILFVGHV